MGAQPVTVRANNITLSDLRKQYIATHLACRDSKQLNFSRTMIKIHADGMKPFATVHARHILETEDQSA
jgi:hypothetical protein